MHQRHWIELFSDYECEIRYHPCKANVVADALSRKERIKLKRVRAISMTIQSSIKDKILAAQNEASEDVNALAEMLRGLDNQMEQWKWERIAMDFISKLPRTRNGHDAIWVIVNRLTKSAHFLPIHEDFKMDRLARLYLNKIIARHDKRRKPLEFSVGDHVLLKESPWKGVVRFGKKGKLAPRFVGPFEITKRIGPVAYRLRLFEEPNGVHDTFHVSNLKKCLADATLHVPLEEIQVDAKLNFVEELVEILK
ncbi:putative reverse transcriptase domain-containing protein [Tanacetum coccineum]